MEGFLPKEVNWNNRRPRIIVAGYIYSHRQTNNRKSSSFRTTSTLSRPLTLMAKGRLFFLMLSLNPISRREILELLINDFRRRRRPCRRRRRPCRRRRRPCRRLLTPCRRRRRPCRRRLTPSRRRRRLYRRRLTPRRRRLTPYRRVVNN